MLAKRSQKGYNCSMVTKMKLLLASFLMAIFVSGLFAQGQFRTISVGSFDYYSDQRYGFNWEQVLIFPLPRNLFLVTAAKGKNGLGDVTGGRLGIAFDLPGAYYGETSYSLDYDWENSLVTHTMLLSGTYESGPAMASLTLSGNFSDTVSGGIVTPSIRYFVFPALALQGKSFIAFQFYKGNDVFFNFAFLGIGEYALAPEILFSGGGSFSTVYEPEANYEKWSVLAGLRVVPTSTFAIKTQFEYTNVQASPTNPHDIFSTMVLVDIKLPKRK